MSASLVRKSLAFVDPDFNLSKSGKKHKGKSEKINLLNLIPENHKIIKKVHQKGQKVQKVNALNSQTKLTIIEARKKYKSEDDILKENLKKLKLIKRVCAIKLDKDITSKIIERAVTRRPIKTKRKSKKQETTAFTEEDFKNFEAEYFGE